MAISYPTFTPEELQSEVWKDIPGYPSYQASNLGRVRSIKILTPRLNKRGYYCVRFKFNGKEKAVTLHAMVVYAFLGPRPPGMVINHLDGKKPNNKLDNLEYCTNAENLAHAGRLGLMAKPKGRKSPSIKRKRGEAHPQHVISEATAIEIKRVLKDRRTIISIAKEFGVSASTISEIKHGHRLGKRQRKLTHEQVRAIEQLLCLRPKEIADRMRISLHIVQDISRNKTWKHLS